MTRRYKKQYLPPSEWPQKDHDAWKWANRHGDLLYPEGIARGWRPLTREKVTKAYGAFLLFLSQNKLLQDKEKPHERLTETNLRPYLELLKAKGHLAPQSITKEFIHISMVVRAMAPNADRSLILNLINRLNQKREPRLDKSGRVVSSKKLFELGIKTIKEAMEMTAKDKIQAAHYRNGLMISLMSICPLRAGVFSAMKLNQHIIETSGGIRIQIAATKMKTPRALDVAFPRLLLGYLVEYLEYYRPHLHPNAKNSDFLWLNFKGEAMSSALTADCFRKLTKPCFGVAISPHRFRDSAATFMYEEHPEHAALAAAVLQHKSFKVTEKYYITGDQRRAALKYQRVIQSLLKKYERKAGGMLK